LDFADQRPRSFTNSTFLCFISDSPLGVRIPQERVQGNRGAEENQAAATTPPGYIQRESHSFPWQGLA
jgi:hypothetical protein